MNIKQLSMLILASAAALLAGCASSPQGQATEDLARIEHIVVIYAENRSFDHLYGLFPGVDGFASATPEQKTQLDHGGNPLPHLPPVYDGGKPGREFPQGLPNGPFRIDAPPASRRMDEILPSPIHAYYHNREQINGGKNNMFVAMSTAGAWVMGYFDGSKMKLWKWAQEYTLADHFFMAAFGGSYLNHQWLVCACTPMATGAPASVTPQLDEKGNLKKKPISPASTSPIRRITRCRRSRRRRSVIRSPQRVSAGCGTQAAGTKRLPTADRIRKRSATSSTTATQAARSSSRTTSHSTTMRGSRRAPPTARAT